MRTRALTAASAAALAALALAGCSTTTPAADSTTAAEAPASGTAAEQVEFTEVWIKANDENMQDMTGAFGILANAGDEDVNLVAATSPVSMHLELHETVDGVMQEKDGGFVIPAGGEYVLEPGGNHIMLMMLETPIEPGDEVPITLEFSDGSTLEVTAMAKPFEGANEEYHG